MLISNSVSRVPRNTASHVNQRLFDTAVKNLERAAEGGREGITERLAELDREWDIERLIGTAAPVILIAGLTLGLKRNRRFLAIPFAVAAALIVHGLEGWAPPLPILRWRGFRTPEEIDEERYALRALRGDFRRLPRRPGPLLAALRH